MTTLQIPSPIAARPSDQAARLRALVDELMARTGPIEVTPEPPPAPIESASQRGPAPVVAITSGKGGVGKTFVSVNLSIALARLGCRVSLVDADPGLANADVICGLTPGRRMGQAAGGGVGSLADLAIEAPGGFKLIPGAVGAEWGTSGASDPKAMEKGLAGLTHVHDAVLIDTGAGLSESVTSILALADLALVVVTPDPTSMADAYAMIKSLRGRAGPVRVRRDRSGPRIGLVVNQACGRSEGLTVHSRLSAVCERFLQCSPELMGVVSHDPRVRNSIRARRPLLADEAARGPAAKETIGLGLRLAAQLGLARAKLVRPQGLIARWRRGRSPEWAGYNEQTT